VTARWLVPTVIYVLAVGAIGVTGGRALRSLQWQDLLVWTAIGYAIVAIVILARGEAVLKLSSATAWAALSGALAIGGLIAFYVAIGHGEVSRVVPITAAYPLVTLALSVVFLSEPVTVVRCVGTGLVIAGVALVSSGR
jgi:transporter family protein